MRPGSQLAMNEVNRMNPCGSLSSGGCRCRQVAIFLRHLEEDKSLQGRSRHSQPVKKIEAESGLPSEGALTVGSPGNASV